MKEQIEKEIMKEYIDKLYNKKNKYHDWWRKVTRERNYFENKAIELEYHLRLVDPNNKLLE